MHNHLPLPLVFISAVLIKHSFITFNLRCWQVVSLFHRSVECERPQAEPGISMPVWVCLGRASEAKLHLCFSSQCFCIPLTGNCCKICKAALFKFVWLKLSNFASMSQDETNKTNKKKCFDSEFFFLSNQSEREMVSQQFSPSSLLWLTWILLNNACAPPPSSRGRQFPNLHRVALNQSSKKYTHTHEVQRFCLYKCCDPDLDPDPDPHPNLTPKSASNEHWHRW